MEVDLSLTGDASYILQAILPYVEQTEHTALDGADPRLAGQDDYKPVDSDTELKPHQIIDEICESGRAPRPFTSPTSASTRCGRRSICTTRNPAVS